MNAPEIKAALRARGYTLTRAAKSLRPHVSREHLSKVIDGYNTSRRVQRGIARLLELPEEEVWAGWQRREYVIVPFPFPFPSIQKGNLS
ncbi:MAG: helix-turn-helix domain-containing protein [Zoogloeaceae bacterium]|jgi:lambda repressor-like predicted transcriptional regulator|nr:helix-turn-helix domain-containing protein [Zoogloeaceae bacterium]